MIKTRKGLFETNSSSTHSISIGIPEIKNKHDNKIPRGDCIFKVPEYRIADGGETETVENTLTSEVYKLSFLFNLVATYVSELNKDDNIPLDTFSGLCGRVVDFANTDDQRKAISKDLVYMKWIGDVVKEETGATIEVPIPRSRNYFPFFETIWSEVDSDFYGEIWKALENGDEDKFKSICREVIFNPEIIIVDRDEAYCCQITNYVL